MEEFKSIELIYAHRVLHPKLVALIACYDKDGIPNAMTAAWISPVSVSPPLIVVSIAPKRYTYELIKKAKVFSVNIPPFELMNKVHQVGTISGRDVKNKLKKIGLTVIKGRKLNVPIIKECIAFLECKLWRDVPAGDHNLVIGEIVDAYAKNGIFDKMYNIDKVSLLYHLGGNNYTTLKTEVHQA